jgi:hypothetical protein
MDGYFCKPRGLRQRFRKILSREFSRGDLMDWILENVAWRPHQVMLGSERYDVNRGQMIVSMNDVAALAGWEETKVRRFMAAFERGGGIRLETLKQNNGYVGTLLTSLIETTTELTGAAVNPPSDDAEAPCPPAAECGETGPFSAAIGSLKRGRQPDNSEPQKPQPTRRMVERVEETPSPAENIVVLHDAAATPQRTRRTPADLLRKRNKEEERRLEGIKSKHSNECSLNARADAHAGAREGVRSLEIINRDLRQPSEPHSDANAATQLLLVGEAVSAAEETPNQPFPRGRARGRRGPVGGYDAGITQGMVAIWNEECGHFATVLRLSPKRHKRLLTLFRDEFAASYDRWREYCSRIAKSDFLSGRVVHKDGRTWRANIDWAIKPASVDNVLEDYYDQTAGQAQDRDAQRRAQVDAKDEDNFRALCAAGVRAAERAAVAGGMDAGVPRPGEPRRSPYSTSDL